MTQDNKTSTEKLYDFLVENEYYTKSYADFEKQFSNEESMTKLYNFMSENEYYTKDVNEFKNQFFSSVGKSKGVSGQNSTIASQESGSNVSTGAPTDERYAEVDTSAFVDLTPEEMELYGYNNPDTLGNIESLKNSFSNLVTSVKKAPHSTQLFLSSIVNSISPKVARDFATFSKVHNPALNTLIYGGQITPDLAISEASRRVSEFNEQMKETKGIVESFKNGDIAGVGAGVVNVVTGIISSAVISTPTAGIGLIATMGGDFIHDYNEIIAKDKGVSVNELVRSGEYEAIIPGAIGATGGLLEKVGLKGVKQAMLSNLNSKVAKQLVSVAWGSNAEGMTEVVQGGLSEVNEAIAEGVTSPTELGKVFGDYVFSEQGLEDYLGGVLGTGVMGTLSRIGNKMISREDGDKFNQEIEKISDIQKDLNNPNLDPNTRATLQKIYDDSLKTVSELMSRDADRYSDFPKHTQRALDDIDLEIDRINDALENQELSNESRLALESRKDELRSRIDDIFEYRENIKSMESVVNGDVVTEQSATEATPEITLNDVLGGVEVEYNGKNGLLIQDGQTIVFREEPNAQGIIRETEIGNINDIESKPLSESGINIPNTRVSISDSGNIVIGNREHLIDPVKPTSAIKYDKDGNIDYVVLKSSDNDSKNRVFRGRIAEDVAYQLTLNEISKNNETRESFEQFINEGEIATEINNERLSETTDGKTETNPEQVSTINSQEIGDSEYNNFVDNGEVSEERLISIANKVKNQEDLSERENAIFTDKTAEINNLIATAPDSQFANSEQQPTSTGTINNTISDSFWDAIKTDEGRKARKEQVLKDFKKSLGSSANMGLNGEALAKAMEYAIISIVDGSVKSAKALQKALNISKEDADKIYNDANVLLEPMKKNLVTPKKTTVKSNIRRATNKGITDKVTIPVKQALADKFKNINRGIADGKRQIKELRLDIKELLGDLRKQGMFNGIVSGRMASALANKINNANTPGTIKSTLNQIERMVKSIDFNNAIRDFSKNRDVAKKFSKNKNTPANLRPILRDISNVDPRYVDDIDNFNELVKSLIVGLRGIGKEGNLNPDDLKSLIDKANKAVAEAKLEKVKSDLLDAGFDIALVESITNVEDGYAILEGMSDNKKLDETPKPRLREFREKSIDDSREHLKENKPNSSEFGSSFNDVFDALMNIDVSALSDDMVGRLAVALKNLTDNNSITGAGPILIEYTKQQRLNNQKDVNSVKKTVRAPNKLLALVNKNISSVWVQIDSILKDRSMVSSFMNITGFGDYIKAYNGFAKRYKSDIINGAEAILKKYQKDLDDPMNRLYAGLYADLANNRLSQTDAERKEAFKARKEAIKKSYENMVSNKDSHWQKENAKLVENYGKLVEDLNNLNSLEDIWDKMNTGNRKMYEFANEFYTKIAPEMRENAEVFNNIEFDGDWEGSYFPRNYIRLGNSNDGKSTNDSKLATFAEGNTFNGTRANVSSKEVSGSNKNRILADNEVRANSYIDLDFFNNFINHSKEVLYDIEVQKQRQLVASILNGKEIVDIFGDKASLDIFKSAVVQKIESDMMGVKSRNTMSGVNALLTDLYGISSRMVLGGVGQIFKQSVPQIVDTTVRLGKNSHLIGRAIMMYYKSDEYKHLFKDSSIETRNTQKTELRDNILTEADRSLIKGSLRKIMGDKVDDIDNIVDIATMSSMKIGDDFASKVSWYANYLDYLERNNIDFDKENANKDAVSYADLQTDLTNNNSDPSAKAKIFRGATGKAINLYSPWISFSVNAGAELANNVSKLSTPLTSDEKGRVIKDIAGNISNVITYNGVASSIRFMTLTASYLLFESLVLNSDDWDDDEKEMIKEFLSGKYKEDIDNWMSNSIEYLVKDLLFRGIAEKGTTPVYESFKGLAIKTFGSEEAKSKLNKSTYSPAPVEEIFEVMGGYGAPFKAFYKAGTHLNRFSMSDEEWQNMKFGVENEYGDKFVTPIGYENEKMPEFSRSTFGAGFLLTSMGLITGSGLQEITSMTNRVSILAKRLENEVYGKDRKTLTEVKSLKKVSLGGGLEYELNDEEYEEIKHIRKTITDYLLGAITAKPENITMLKNFEPGKFVEIREKIAKSAGEEYAINTIREVLTDLAEAEFILKLINDDKHKEIIEKYTKSELKDINKTIKHASDYSTKLLNGEITVKEYEKRQYKR